MRSLARRDHDYQLVEPGNPVTLELPGEGANGAKLSFQTVDEDALASVQISNDGGENYEPWPCMDSDSNQYTKEDDIPVFSGMTMYVEIGGASHLKVLSNSLTFKVALAATFPAMVLLQTGVVTVNVVPGAVNLQSEHIEDDPHVNGHVGIAPVLVRRDQDLIRTPIDGDYLMQSADPLGAGKVNTERKTVIDSLEALTGWTAFDTDTENLALSDHHIIGQKSISFDKANTAANKTIAGIQKTLTSIDLSHLQLHDLIQTSVFLSSISNVAYVFVRIGTNATNHNEWRVLNTELTAGENNPLLLALATCQASVTGTGWNPAAVTYVAVGVAFNLETNTLAGIRFEQVAAFSNPHTTSNPVEVTANIVSSNNINVQRWGGALVPAASAMGDNMSNASLVPRMGSYLALFDGTTWDRWRGDSVGGAFLQGPVAHDSPAAGNPVIAGGVARSAIPTAVTAADAVHPYFDDEGRQVCRGAHQDHGVWTVFSAPGSGNRGTITKALVTGKKNVATAISARFMNSTTSPGATVHSLSIKDGASGSTAIWTDYIGLPDVAGQVFGANLSGIWVPGTVGTAMTYEFSAAQANAFQSVVLHGTVIS